MFAWVKATIALVLLGAPEVRSLGDRQAWVQPSPNPGAPALVVLHASASSAGQIERLTGFSELEDKPNILYPEAVESGWNDGRPDAFPPHGGQDDVAFVDQCLELAVTQYKADPKKLYVVGFDTGGDLALLCGQRLPRLAGVASVMGGLSPALGAPSSTPLLTVASEADPCFPFQGGNIRYFGGRARGQILASDELMRRWTGQIQPTAVEGTKENWGPKAIRYRLKSAGHLWPGTEAPVSEQMFGPLAHDFKATQVIWDFFKALP
ncbi:MAG: dienelactone hydrolase family protein [Candidatus Eremiobacteraeota bacterium]|nr:dienelactone hydrolase family protein [Candidatus Eremiobacteraeota bacterium]